MSRSTRQCCVSANKNDGFLRVAAASPQIRVADVEDNVEAALAAVRGGCRARRSRAGAARAQLVRLYRGRPAP